MTTHHRAAHQGTTPSEPPTQTKSCAQESAGLSVIDSASESPAGGLEG